MARRRSPSRTSSTHQAPHPLAGSLHYAYSGSNGRPLRRHLRKLSTLGLDDLHSYPDGLTPTTSFRGGGSSTRTTGFYGRHDSRFTLPTSAPSIAISGAGQRRRGLGLTALTLGAVSDPGADTVTSYIVHWGDGNTYSYGSNGVQTHTYADGA